MPDRQGVTEGYKLWTRVSHTKRTEKCRILSSYLPHAGFLLDSFLTLKMEVIYSSETSIHILTTRRFNPEDGNIQHTSYIIRAKGTILKIGTEILRKTSAPRRNSEDRRTYSSPHLNCRTKECQFVYQMYKLNLKWTQSNCTEFLHYIFMFIQEIWFLASSRRSSTAE